jgi:ribosome-associated toxin RatA of RatAB toxin-antitoxin module
MRTAGRSWPSRLFALALVPGLGAAQQPAWPLAAELERGEVVVRVDDDGRFRGHIELAVAIAAAPDRIWGVLRDCARAPEYVPHVQSCELIERLDQGRAELFRQRIRFRWFLPPFEHVFRLDYEPYSTMTVRRVDGPLRRLDGRWSLHPQGDGRTVLIHVLDFESGLPVPRFMVARSMLHDLPEVLREIRRRAELRP